MAMQHTDELDQVVGVIFEELKKMGFTHTLCAIGIFDKETKGADWWSFIQKGSLPGAYHFPYLDGRWFKELYDVWIQQKAFHYLEMQGAEWVDHNRLVFEQTDWKNLPEDVKNELKALAPISYKASFISMKCGLLEVVDDRAITDDQIHLLQRFTKVIDFTYNRVADLQQAEKQARELEKVFKENQRLLHSILPEQIAEKIRGGQQTVVRRFEEVSILFADIVGFTVLSEQITPQEVVDILNGLFSKFDDLTDKYHLEKIKTIGDAYMAVGGVPEENRANAFNVTNAAIDMLKYVRSVNVSENGPQVDIRVGLHTGEVVAGVVGNKKFQFDIWGDAVNTAARMEQNGSPGKLNISSSTYNIIKDTFSCTYRGKIHAKNKGELDMYYVDLL